MLRQLIFLIFLIISANAAQIPVTVLPPTSTNAPLNVTSFEEENVGVEEKSVPIISNPSYDPAIHQSFNPQDAVQSYVRQHGIPLYPSTGAQYPQYTEAYVPTYENYLIPIERPVEPRKEVATKDGFLANMAPVATNLMHVAIKIGFVLLATAIGVIGGAFIHLILCLFTPYCPGSVLGIPKPSAKDFSQSVDKIGGVEFSTDRVRRAAEFVIGAIEKYENLQKIARVSRLYK